MISKKYELDWIKQTQESNVPQQMKIAGTMMAYRTGVLAWYNYPVSTRRVEMNNNKIKVMKRDAYGFRDERCFELMLYALYDCCSTPNLG